MSGNNGCCDETTVNTPPFSELRGGGRRKIALIESAKNPIPDEIKDTDKLSRFFEKYRLVPYAGHTKGTGHSLLLWYKMLAQLSPMHGACIEKMKKYVVGSRAKFVRAEDPEFDPGTENLPLTATELTAYGEALKKHIVFDGGVRDLHKNIVGSFKEVGNAFVMLSMSIINGQAKASISHINETNVIYIDPEPGEVKSVMISPVWDTGYMKKHPPTILPVFPNFKKGDDGVIRMVFHLKNGGQWYGRPDSKSSDLYKYREVQDAIYTIRQAAANFTGQVIIEVEDGGGVSPAIDNDDAQRNGFDSFADRMEQNYTQKGEDPQSVFVTSRPFGSRPMFVFQLKPNTNENWYKVTGEVNEQKILRSHQLTLRFMGFDAATGFATDSFIGDYIMNVEPVINELRTTIMTFTNSILSYVWEAFGMPEMNQYSLTFESPISSQVEEYKTRQKEQANGTADPNNSL
jgi:hypothetical protein